MEQVRNKIEQTRDREVLAKYAYHFRSIEDELESALSSKVSAIEKMARHTLLGQGKRLRPLLFVLCANLFGNEAEDLYRLSVVFEYIHTASLLHDDVLDNAEVRRKKPSANTLWGNHAAVLVGDFLYSKAFVRAIDLANLQFFRKLTRTTTIMAEGQVLELLHTGDWNLDVDTYFNIIVAKTAVLISAACACGGIISGADDDEVARLESFGMNMGVAFQLVDDILDYTSTEKVFGKPVGKDLSEGKVTLPLIYALQSTSGPERQRVVSMLSEIGENEDSRKKVVELVRKSGALERVRREAGAYVRKAGRQLETFPSSEARDNLLELSQYIVERSF
ncbi:MAG: octaprenyl diphosphate synthase [Deltaproteobacteria bacterium]|nr:MAG: octaprenyl diphosphate synthase [Deltaproteobacteria bacterium]